MQLSDGLVQIGGTALYVRHLGRPRPDAPPLLVIHGGPDWDHSYLLPGLECVAESRHVLAFDLRGCGRSTQGLGAAGYQPEYVVDDIGLLLDALGVGTVDLLGFSTGGQLAQLVIGARPDRVSRAVLASTTAYPLDAAEFDGWEAYRSRKQVRAPWPAWSGFDRGRPRNDTEATIEWAIEAAPTQIWNLDRLDGYLELLAGVRFTGEWIGPFRDGLLHPWRPDDPAGVLRRFGGGRVLILHGAQDMAFPVALARRLHRDVAGSELVVIESAGHMTHVDEPGQWANAVTAFLDRRS